MITPAILFTQYNTLKLVNLTRGRRHQKNYSNNVSGVYIPDKKVARGVKSIASDK